MRLLRIVWLVPVLLLAGCLDAEPSRQTMMDQIDAKVQQDTLGMFRVVKLEKLNGFKPDDRHYQAKVHLVMEVVKTPDQALRELENDSRPPLEKMAAGLVIGAIKMSVGDLKVGDVHEKTAVYEFIRTEKGWRLDREVTDSNL
ncbi:hypothetical protein [Sulfurivirga sp.]|uniref:hypothetical protein n=1 Tax=Sulfurivirga sp. TaxID=2614236 RepID=UPI0025D46F4B|nr:hypothetical protein [Sulfurivirga sp.]